MMLSPKEVAQFQHDGFINGGRVLNDAQVQELRDELDRILSIGPNGFGPNDPKPVLFRNLAGEGKPIVWQIVNMWEASKAFERLIYNPRIVEVISQLTGMPDLMVWHDQLQYKPANIGGTTGWHQDAPLWPSIAPMTPVSAWIPLDDADRENGCMWMMPNSHAWGNQIQFLGANAGKAWEEIGADFKLPPGAAVKTVRPVCWPVKKGEVSFHHSLTWHGSPDNKSPRPRRAIAIHYMTGEARFVASGGHPMQQFINLPDGAKMIDAGEHFPIVCRGGKPVGIPDRLRPAMA